MRIYTILTKAARRLAIDTVYGDGGGIRRGDDEIDIDDLSYCG